MLGNFAGVNPFVAVPLGALAAGLIAVPVSYVAFRLQGGYFAIGTWVIAEVFRLSFANASFVGGGSGTSLTALRGIGPWTADMISLFYFREPDIWPLGDLAVRKTFERFVAEQSRFDLERAAMLFAPHRSLLALYMWRITDAMPTR
jgi:ABC-type branched-subunit amino acid transport system permease subunit